jgi:orotidine-5'-phosphate decarboxylase
VEDGSYAKYCNAGHGVQMVIAHGTAGADTVRGFVAVRLMWR